MNLQRQHQQIKNRLLAAIEEVIDSGRFILGPKVRELETRIAEFTGSAYAVGCASGTDALHLALRALDIGPGDAVITSPYTFFASAEAISLAGARPVFCDIELGTFNLDPARVDESITTGCDWNERELVLRGNRNRVKAIMPIHLFGQCANMKPILTLARRYRLEVVEDCAQSFGAQQLLDGRWRRAGSLGTLGCFSFFPSKNLNALGDGGMVTTSSPGLRDRLRMLREHGAESRHVHHFIGLNSRLDELQAAVLLVKLEMMTELNAHRRELFEYYSQELAGIVGTPNVPDWNHSVFNQYIIRIESRDALAGFLKDRGIATAIYYPVPLHLQKCYAGLGYQPGDFPRAEQASWETLALPIDPMMTTEERDYIVASVKAFREG